MKNYAKKMIWLFMISIVVFSITGCKKNKEIEERSEIVAEQEKDDEKEKELEVIPENQNILTGLADLSEEAIGKRPVAVMVNNVMDAMPQYGVEQADVIFEIPVEADLTRLMALYADYTKVPKICAVRSCRYYFPAISEGFDAFYVHWGCDPTIEEYMASLNLDKYDGMSNPGELFGRDQERLNSGYSLEHTGYFDGTKFAAFIQSQGTRTDLEADKTGTAFVFNGTNEQLKPTEDVCTNININFGGQTAGFTYDESSKTYKKTNCGEKHIDVKTGNQLAFTNVIVLETTFSIRDDVGRKNVNITGGNDYAGYYISNGAIQKIFWLKESEASRLRFFDENGEEIAINRGKSYIAFNYAGQTTFE
ncbi:MAG: DUF3048 domain-containing protein [Schaedlerella sp.]|nr:DUF3048 domain-containing protein [Schaedlerella sp.]